MACGCYPNGVVQVIIFQVLLFVGWILSLAALGDCKFVEIGREPTGPPLLDDDRFDFSRGLGFLIFEKAGGGCLYDPSQTVFDNYKDRFLGDDWNTSRAFAITTAIMGLVLWIWSLCLICLPHGKIVRFIIMFLLFCTVLFQGLTFMVLGSDFCDFYKCDFSRSAGLSVGALLCYFICACILCCMSDNPLGEDEATPVHEPYAEAEDKAAPEEQPAEEEVVAQSGVADEEAGSEGDDEAGGSGDDQPKKKWWKFGKN